MERAASLTDLVIDRAIAARARVAVLPRCHVFKANSQGGLFGWVNRTLAIDIMGLEARTERRSRENTDHSRHRHAQNRLRLATT